MTVHSSLFSETSVFFDGLAPSWDSRQSAETLKTAEAIIARINPLPRDSVLDVGCGTGILVPFLEKRGIARYAGIDFSAAMAGEFAKKFPEREIVTADYLDEGIFEPGSFSKIIIFNSFPHFSDKRRVFSVALNCLARGGGLFIVHAMSRRAVNLHHKKAPRQVSGHVLETPRKIRDYYSSAGFSEVVVEDSPYFYSSGKKLSL